MSRSADEIDYELIGDDLQAVIVTLDPGETVIAEAGAMMFMEDGIEMNTTLDPNKQGGGMLGKLFSGAKRVLSGDTFFITTFMNAARERRNVAFSSPFPGKCDEKATRRRAFTALANVVMKKVSPERTRLAPEKSLPSIPPPCLLGSRVVFISIPCSMNIIAPASAITVSPGSRVTITACRSSPISS